MPRAAAVVRVSVGVAVVASSLMWCTQGARAQDGAAPPATPPAPPAGVVPNGRVIDGGGNIRDFAPEDTSVEVDADNANLRKMFEQFGPDAIEWYQHVQTLANPMFEGRSPGSDGMERAAEYVEWWINKVGLQPAFPAEATGGATTAPTPGTASAMPAPSDAPWVSHRQFLELPGGGFEVKRGELALGGATFKRGDEFVVLGSSGAGEVTAPITFVGYGIKEGKDGYTSFAPDARLDGRVVVLFRYEPMDEEGQSLWSDRRFSEHAAILPKLNELAARGAAGVILVNPPNSKQGKKTLETTESSNFGGSFKIPMVQVTEEVATKLLAGADTVGAEPRSLMHWRRLADTGEVKSVNLSDSAKVTLATDVAEKKIRTCNLGGVVPGRGALASEWLIIGAHYDHVGMGMFGTSPANRGQLHPGADDNASGTAALIVLARRFMEQAKKAPPEQPMRSVLFLWFTAEESGLNGSRHYVRNPTVSGEKTTAMINLDMVGRLRNDELSVSGTGTAEGLMEIVAPHFAKSGLTISVNPSGRGPSDHANFYGAGIPVLFPFTGTHAEYHTPRDKAFTVNPHGAMQVVDLIESIATDLASRPEKLTFSNTDSGPGADRGYASVRLGVTPSMGGEETTGVVVDAVAEGTSAAEAGIKQGDVLIAWNGEEMSGPGDLMENLRKHKPGDQVQIVLMRDGEKQVVTATMKAGGGRRGGRGGANE